MSARRPFDSSADGPLLSAYVDGELDADAREPTVPAQGIPGDIPLAGREVYGQLVVRF